LQVEILRKPPFDKAGEQRIVERAPPVGQIGGLGRTMARGHGGLAVKSGASAETGRS
jgi:hypothetical protein